MAVVLHRHFCLHAFEFILYLVLALLKVALVNFALNEYMIWYDEDTARNLLHRENRLVKTHIIKMQKRFSKTRDITARVTAAEYNFLKIF